MHTSNHSILARLRRLLALALLLSACGRLAPDAAQPVPTGAVAPCDLRVTGRWITGPVGTPMVLHGANLPTLVEMDNSSENTVMRLHELANAGARIVRLPVDFKEVTPTFVPAKVSPFVQQANQLGMIVILSWNVTLTEPADAVPEADPLDTSVDDAENWLRQEILYLSNNPGVWFDLYNGTSNVSPLRQRNIAQRLVDVARGYKAKNIIVVNDPAWLLSPDPGINKPLSGNNIVYGLDGQGIITPMLKTAGAAAGYDIKRLPFIVTRWTHTADLARLQALDIGSITLNSQGPLPAELSRFWQTHQANWAACRGK